MVWELLRSVGHGSGKCRYSRILGYLFPKQKCASGQVSYFTLVIISIRLLNGIENCAMAFPIGNKTYGFVCGTDQMTREAAASQG